MSCPSSNARVRPDSPQRPSILDRQDRPDCQPRLMSAVTSNGDSAAPYPLTDASRASFEQASLATSRLLVLDSVVGFGSLRSLITQRTPRGRVGDPSGVGRRVGTERGLLGWTDSAVGSRPSDIRSRCQLRKCDRVLVTGRRATPLQLPKRMEVPWTVPWILVGTSLDPETMIVPLRSCPDCCHVSVNVPLKAPL